MWYLGIIVASRLCFGTSDGSLDTLLYGCSTLTQLRKPLVDLWNGNRRVNGTGYPSLFFLLSFPSLWFTLKGVRVPYHAWQLTQRSPRRRKYQIIPRLSVQSYEPSRSALSAPFHLGCTVQGGMMGRVGFSSIRYGGYPARTHLRPSLHCTALRCTAGTTMYV